MSETYQFLMNASNALNIEGLVKKLPTNIYSIGKTKDVASPVSSGVEWLWPSFRFVSTAFLPSAQSHTVFSFSSYS